MRGHWLRVRQLALDANSAWYELRLWFVNGFRLGSVRAVVVRLVFVAQSAFLFWACWASLRARTSLDGVWAGFLAFGVCLIIAYVACAAFTLLHARAAAKEYNRVSSPRVGLRRFVFRLGRALTIAFPLWIVLKLGSQAHGFFGRVKAVDGGLFKWSVLLLLLIVPLLKARHAFEKWREKRDNHLDLMCDAKQCGTLLEDLAPVAAADRLTPEALAERLGMQVGDALPEQAYALRAVIPAVYADADAIPLKVRLDQDALHKIWAATEKLRVAHVKTTQQHGESHRRGASGPET